MKLIVAADRNWAIGRSGGLPWHLAGDMRFFRETTTGHVVVMGRATLESFPGRRPLPNRVNIVLTRNQAYEAPGTVLVHSEEELREELTKYDPDQVFVIGGAQVYRALLPQVNTCYVTRVDGTFEADAYLPDLEKEGFHLAWESGEEEENGIRYRFTRYER